MIEACELRKNYGAVEAVSGLTFAITANEVVGLLGPNGAGKTTTMRMLTTYLAPSAGTALVAGFDIGLHPDEVRKNIGYLPETPALYGEMKVVEYLRFVAKIKNVPRRLLKAQLDESIERCGLTEVTDRLCSQISKGFRQRTGLAAALVHKPRVIILDEPTSGLDPGQIIEVRKLIRELGQAHTVILSTHILPEVASTCSRVLIIARGRIVVEGSVAELTKEKTLEERFLEAVAGDSLQAEAA